ncbi:hypothetical protein AMTR_s00350p00012520 [Amborella trichopoda]|uniref:Uncharacterized protein n=1 Tax=Amborella trichopoda TaxID=13333 RepID=W1NP07_AMBTC|nr:hypothetical protein AMTR_s00350p00012520 [Amborella trichopoda]
MDAVARTTSLGKDEDITVMETHDIFQNQQRPNGKQLELSIDDGYHNLKDGDENKEVALGESVNLGDGICPSRDNRCKDTQLVANVLQEGTSRGDIDVDVVGALPVAGKVVNKFYDEVLRATKNQQDEANVATQFQVNSGALNEEEKEEACNRNLELMVVSMPGSESISKEMIGGLSLSSSSNSNVCEEGDDGLEPSSKQLQEQVAGDGIIKPNNRLL